jgi:hypothetical protein
VSDVFISHSAKDKAAAAAVYDALTGRGIQCWLAGRSIVPAEPYPDEIVKAIEESRIMVLVFSSHANTSKHVLREVTCALDMNIPLIPLRIEDVLPKGGLRLFLSVAQWLDAFSPPLSHHLDKLVTTVQGRLGPSAATISKPSTRDPRKVAGDIVRQAIAWRAGPQQPGLFGTYVVEMCERSQVYANKLAALMTADGNPSANEAMISPAALYATCYALREICDTAAFKIGKELSAKKRGGIHRELAIPPSETVLLFFGIPSFGVSGLAVGTRGIYIKDSASKASFHPWDRFITEKLNFDHKSGWAGCKATIGSDVLLGIHPPYEPHRKPSSSNPDRNYDFGDESLDHALKALRDLHQATRAASARLRCDNELAVIDAIDRGLAPWP